MARTRYSFLRTDILSKTGNLVTIVSSLWSRFLIKKIYMLTFIDVTFPSLCLNMFAFWWKFDENPDRKKKNKKCLKIFRPSGFFISFVRFSCRTAPIVLLVSTPNLLVLLFFLVTVTPDLKLQEAFLSKFKISLMIGGDYPILTLYISVNKYRKFLMYGNWFAKF